MHGAYLLNKECVRPGNRLVQGILNISVYVRSVVVKSIEMIRRISICIMDEDLNDR